MQIVSKKKAMDILTNSLFNPVNGGTLNTSKFCAGKYNWTGKAADYVGKVVPDIKGVHAVYVQRRTDSNGPYAQMMAISE